MRPVVVALLAFAIVASGCADPGTGGDADTDSEATGTVTGSQTRTSTASTGSASATSSGTPAAGGDTSANAAPAISDLAANVTGLAVEFIFNASDADGDTLTYELAFGDNGTPASGPMAGLTNATYTYAAAGTYNATLTVTDGTASVNQTLAVTVAEAVSAPAIVQTLTCTIAQGLPAPVRLLGANGIPGLGGCLTGSLGQDSVLVAANYGAECLSDPDIKVGDKAASGDTFDVYCDESVSDFEVRLDFGAA